MSFLLLTQKIVFLLQIRIFPCKFAQLESCFDLHTLIKFIFTSSQCNLSVYNLPSRLII